MFPAAFDYSAPTSLEDVPRTLAERGDYAKVLPGGQSLIPLRAPAGGRRSGSQEEIALQALAEVAGLRRERIAAERVTPADVTGFAIDPVCGMTVDVPAAMHIVEHGGDVYYFCSRGCAEQFRADPQPFPAAKAG